MGKITLQQSPGLGRGEPGRPGPESIARRSRGDNVETVRGGSELSPPHLKERSLELHRRSRR